MYSRLKYRLRVNVNLFNSVCSNQNFQIINGNAYEYFTNVSEWPSIGLALLWGKIWSSLLILNLCFPTNCCRIKLRNRIDSTDPNRSGWPETWNQVDSNHNRSDMNFTWADLNWPETWNYLCVYFTDLTFLDILMLFNNFDSC